MSLGAPRASLLAALVLLGAACSSKPPKALREQLADSAAKSSRPRYAVYHPLRVRVFADADYRREHIGWRGDFKAIAARANRYLEQRFGVTLELAEMTDWERPSDKDDLSTALRELEAADEGRGCDLVVGLVTALPIVAATMDQIGMARVLGKHLVLRGTGDHVERERLLSRNRKTGLIDGLAGEGADQDALNTFEDRMAHRAAVVFLHEIGHVLGALHVDQTTSFMREVYDTQEMEFDAPNATLIELSLGHLLRSRAKKDAPPEVPVEVIEHVETAKDTGWRERERLVLLKILRSVGRMRAPGAENVLAAAFEHARVVAKEGRVEEALDLLGAQLDRAPEDAWVAATACAIGVEYAARDPRCTEWCKQARAFAPDDAGPALNLALAAISGGGDRQAIAGALSEARALIEASDRPELWIHLAGLYARAWLVTRAEEALARAKTESSAKELAAWAAGARKSYGLTRAEVAPDEEPELIATIRELHAITDRKKRAARAREALARWPRSPVLHSELCKAELEQMNRKAAETSCRRALELDDTMPNAHVHASVLATMSGRPNDAVVHAERAKELAPENSDAWIFLADRYRRAKMTSRLEALRVAYEATFKKPLGK